MSAGEGDKMRTSNNGFHNKYEMFQVTNTCILTGNISSSPEALCDKGLRDTLGALLPAGDIFVKKDLILV